MTLQIRTNIPGTIEVMAGVSLIGQKPDDIFIGKSQRTRVVNGSGTAILDVAELPSGQYTAEVDFYPRWGFSDEISRSSGARDQLHAGSEIAIGGTGEASSHAQQRENSQAWVMNNAFPGDPWEMDEWETRFGKPERVAVEGLNPNAIYAYYFPSIDMTIFVNNARQVISHWRIGRANR